MRYLCAFETKNWMFHRNEPSLFRGEASVLRLLCLLSAHDLSHSRRQAWGTPARHVSPIQETALIQIFHQRLFQPVKFCGALGSRLVQRDWAFWHVEAFNLPLLFWLGHVAICGVKNGHANWLIFAGCRGRNCAQIVYIALILWLSTSIVVSSSWFDFNGAYFFAQVHPLHLVSVVLNPRCLVYLRILISCLF